MSLARVESIFNGPQVTIDNDLVHKLKFGDQILGWEGDPDLELAYNRQTDRVELWKGLPNGSWTLIVQSRPGIRIVDMNLIKFLVTHDSQRGFDVKAYIDKHNAKTQKENERKAQEKVDEATEKVQFAIKQDLRGSIYQ